mgnify:CR=1 FL=1
MSLLAWLFREHPFLQSIQQTVLDAGAESSADFDELVVRARLPVRTVLLAVQAASDLGRFQHSSPKQAPDYVTQSRSGLLPAMITTTYLQEVVSREEPVLLWGQRRLIPNSALERAHYILKWLPNKGRAVFLGDDDAVSPLVAASSPQTNVDVLDIDSGVLSEAERIAKALGARITTQHVDLSEGQESNWGTADVVVCDPCPTADGAFEAMFWQSATRFLKPAGTLITTLAPSHKPREFSAGALAQLQRLGFCIYDLQAEYGKYEIFGFEFLPVEYNVLQKFNWVSHVSQTKSICAAKYVCDTSYKPSFDFNKWVKFTNGHYLTVQAGVDAQQDLVAVRHPRPVQKTVEESLPSGLRIEALIPVAQRRLPAISRQSPEWITSVLSKLEQMGADIENEEVAEIERLARCADIKSCGPLAWLGLTVRAIESWERGSYDD